MFLAPELNDPRVGGEDLVSALELIAALMARPAWQARARCRGYGPEAFFDDPERAAATCAGCPVRSECAKAGMSERFGVWGGLSERERRRKVELAS